MKRHARDLGAMGALLLLHVVLYRKIVRLFWTFDDTDLLQSMFDTPLRDFFTEGSAWPQQLFTPFMFVARRRHGLLRRPLSMSQ